MGCMYDVGKCQVVDFFSFYSPPFFPCYLLLACVVAGLDNLFIQVSANKHDIFLVAFFDVGIRDFFWTVNKLE